MFNNYYHLKYLWDSLKGNENFWVVSEVEGGLFIDFNNENAHAFVNCYFDKTEALDYMQSLIEQDLFRPSEVTVIPLTLNEIISLKDEFEVLAEKEYNTPVKVTINKKVSNIPMEDDIINSLVEMN